MPMFNMEDAIQYFRDHEGVVPHMYLDVVGLVTVGVGFLLRKQADATALAFVNRKTGQPASASEIRADWKAVSEQEAAKRAAYYRKFTQHDLPDAEIDKRLTTYIEDFTKALRKQFSEFESFPASAQLALLDMIYSLGPSGFKSGYPKLCAAVLRKDWNTAAGECSRKGVSPSRNQDCRQLFLDAAMAAQPLAFAPPETPPAARPAKTTRKQPKAKRAPGKRKSRKPPVS